MKRALLRIILCGAAISWLVSVYGVFMPWASTEAVLRGFGLNAFTYDPMMEYWLRMTSMAFVGGGLFYGMLALWPEKYPSLIAPAAIFLIAEGLVLLFYGIRLGLPPLPFYADTACCLVGGGAILALRPHPGNQPTSASAPS